jgi:hypothetical protein
MDIELKEKLESLKSDGKKKKGCASCKKKKHPVVLPELIEEDLYIPTPDEIRLAFIELGNRVEDKREFINKVYRFLFNEEFNFGCTSCLNAQARRLKNYIIEVLKLKV